MIKVSMYQVKSNPLKKILNVEEEDIVTHMGDDKTPQLKSSTSLGAHGGICHMDTKPYFTACLILVILALVMRYSQPGFIYLHKIVRQIIYLKLSGTKQQSTFPLVDRLEQIPLAYSHY
jgi:hypothetical protein